DFLRPAYLDAAAEPPAAGHGHRPGSHRAGQDYGTGQDYRAGHDYGAGQEYGYHRDPEASPDYPAGPGYPAGPSPSGWDYRSPVAVGVSTGPLPESHPYGEPGGQDSDPPGSSGSFA